MIQFLQHAMIDKERWDECIGKAENGNLNSYSWYLDIVSPGWCALVEPDYNMVFPLPVSSRAGFKYIMQPYFTQQLGLFYDSFLNDEKLAEFLNRIPSSFKYININLNSSNPLQGGKVTDLTNLELDLSDNYDKITEGYQNNLRRNLKKAAQNKLTLSTNLQPEELITLFRANKGQYLKHLNDRQYSLIQQIAKVSLQKGIGEIWGAYDELNELTAGILWITINRKSVFLFSALSDRGKKLSAMPWLIDIFIRQNAGKSHILDFEGSNNESLARFYSSFGAKKVTYYRWEKNSLPFPFRILLKIWQLRKLELKKYFHLSK